MNRDRFEGRSKQLVGILMEQWGRLTRNHPHVVAGKRKQRFGRLQEQYGTSIEGAARQLREFRARNRDWNTSIR